MALVGSWEGSTLTAWVRVEPSPMAGRRSWLSIGHGPKEEKENKGKEKKRRKNGKLKKNRKILKKIVDVNAGHAI